MKKTVTFTYKDYPKPDQQRSGCKVSWYYYRDRKDADAASLAAKHNANIQRALGYDFGFQCPGSVIGMEPGNHQYSGMWEVCLP